MSVQEHQVQKGDIGVVIVLTIKDQDDNIEDISLATTKDIYLKSPNGTLKQKTGAFTANGVDGRLQYTTISGDLDVAGDWWAQANVELPDGTWRTTKFRFRVNTNLE
jgi:hypothetical protein